jgi:hypothetical protein
MMKKEKINIRVKWARKRPAKLVIKGDQASEIRWLDTGSSQTISNEQLDFLDEKRENKKIGEKS